MNKVNSRTDFMKFEGNSFRGNFEERKNNSTEIAEEVMSELTDDASRECMSYNEEDIVKRIKHLRRLNEGGTSAELTSMVFNSWSESLEDNVEEEDDCVDVCDRHWKRRRSGSPCYFGDINISPVKKPIRCDSPSSSTKCASKSNPWAATETPPTIFWSYVKSREVEIESEPLSYSFVGSDDNPEEEVQMAFNDDAFNDVCDLREILKQKRKRQNQDPTSNYVKQGSIIERINVNVKDTRIGKVVEINEGEQNLSNYEPSECEEGEIFDYDGIDYQCKDDAHESLYPLYRGYRMSDLIRKKKVLEHLIDMANKEECEGSIDNISSGPDCLKESKDEKNVFTTNNVTTQRKVVYRGSSPDIDPEIRENIKKDFTTEMDKRMSELFRSQIEEDEYDVPIKVEPLSEGEGADDLSEAITRPMITESSKENSPWSCKFKPELKVEDRRSKSPSRYKYECSICKVTVGTKLNMEQHRKGKRHKFNIEREKHTRAGASSGHDNYRSREGEQHWDSPCGKQPRTVVSKSANYKRSVMGVSAKRKQIPEKSAIDYGCGIDSKNIKDASKVANLRDITRNIKDADGKRNVKKKFVKCPVDENVGNKSRECTSKSLRKRIVWP